VTKRSRSSARVARPRHLGREDAGIDGIRAARAIAEQHKVAVLILTAFSQRD